MSRVSELLRYKSSVIHSVRRDDTVRHAILTMTENDVGAVLVLEGERVHGIFTERDVLRRVALAGRPPESTRVHEVMTSRLVVLGPKSTVEDCMATMTRARVRHLPIVDGARLVGVVSIGDVVRHLSAEREMELAHLTDYVQGRYPA